MTPTRPTPSGRSRLRSAAAAAAAVFVLAGAAGCALGLTASPTAASTVATSPAEAPDAQRIVLRFDDGVALATLSDTPTSRQLAELLPLTLELRDSMGQAKTGRLPTPINYAPTALVTDPDGGIYYVPGSDMLAIFYDDLGQTVPSPGLIRLGTVEEPNLVAKQGNRVQVRIDLVDQANT